MIKNKKTFTARLLQTAIVLVTLSSATACTHDNTLSEAEKSQGWELLFNGKDMSQWRNFKKPDISDKWQVNNGEMQLTGKGGGDILTKETYESFDLTLDWKISIAGNSGIFIMADEIGKKIYSHAVEVQIIDNERHADTKVASHLSGSIYDITASPKASHKPAGEWNSIRILLKDKMLKVWQNNIVTADVTIGSEQWNTLVGKSKFKDWQGFALNDIGHIGLQDHRDPVAFKNIKIKKL
tara:strand:- start:2615 stop:3331 length:717 start_codon:yes stop_codon:yes gene_type:complete